MKRALVKMVAVVVLGLLPFSAWAGEQKATPGQIAAVKLMTLQKKGIVFLVPNAPYVNLYVEPLIWKRMTHQQKFNLGVLLMDYTKELNPEKGKKYEDAFINDMTTKDFLGTIYIKENRIEITK